MFTVVKEKITFEKKNHEVLIFENGKYLTRISEAVYTVLSVFNGEIDDAGIIALFSEVYDLQPSDAEVLLNMLIEKFRYVLTRNNEKSIVRKFDVFIDNYTYINYKRIRNIVPSMLVISLTRDCFMRCRYCYADAHCSNVTNPENSMDIKEIERIIVEAKRLEISHIELTGGDPFVREDIFEVLDLFEKYHVTTALSTKKILNDFEIKKLAGYDVIHELQISLDTLDDEIEEMLISSRNYSTKMLKVIEKLVQSGINVKVNSVITKYNINDIYDLTMRLNSMGVKTHIISPYTANLGRNEEDFFPDIEQYEKLFANLDNMKLQMKIDHPVAELITLCNREQLYHEKGDVVCSAGMDGFIIAPNGDVSVCERMAYSSFTIGNIKNSSIMDIWNSEKLESFASPQVEQFEGTRCDNCEEREFCIEQRGICYVHSFILNGSIYSPDNFCKYYDFKKRIY